MNYILANSGSMPLQWKVTSTANWLHTFPVSGAIQPMQSASFSLGIGMNAYSFESGTYSGSLIIENLTTGKGNTTRSIALFVYASASAFLSVMPSTGVVYEGMQGGPFMQRP
jgi:hypothetical protein